ncbi:hypothetical protein ABWH92_07120 [Ahrensia marina]|uniref:hypothetical protein n=1 Tax=Ahrensia marina TaxID=1514904 RepID=UPI0035CE8FA7
MQQAASAKASVQSRSALGDASQEKLTELAWFLTFLSWIPIITGTNSHPILGWLGLSDSATYLLAEQRSLIAEPLGLYTVCTALAVWLAWRLRSRVFALATVSLALSCFVFLFSDNSAADFIYLPLYYAHVALCTIMMLLFVSFGRILSTSFLAFVALLLVDATIYSVTETYWLATVPIDTPWPGEPVTLFGQVLNGYAPSLGKVAVFVFSIALMRLIFMAYRDNRTMAKALGGKRIWETFKPTVGLWWPVLAVFIVMTFVYSFLAGRAENALMCQLEPDFVVEVAILTSSGTQIEQRCIPRGHATLESTLQSYLDAQYAQMENQLNQAINEAVRASNQATDNAPDAIVGRIEETTAGRLPGTRHKRCGWDIVVCPIGNGLRSMANASYQKSRTAAIRDLDQELNALATEFEGDVEGYEAAAKAAVTHRLDQAKRTTQTANSGAFAIYRFASYLLLLYSGILLLKTFLMVFARVLFDPAGKHSMSAHFTEDPSKSGQGTLKVKKTEILVRKDVRDDRFYAYGSVQISGPKKARSFVLGLRFLITRLLSRRFSFLHVPGKRTARTDHSVKLNVEAPNQLIEWTLKPGERVFFRFPDLVGFSDTVDFGRLASMSVTTLYFGRIFHYYAKGPGTLYFKTKAKPVTSAERSGNRPFDPALLVAWTAPIRFFVDAKLDIRNTFLSSYNLCWDKAGHYLRDTSPTREGGTTTGIIRFVKHFLLPI